MTSEILKREEIECEGERNRERERGRETFTKKQYKQNVEVKLKDYTHARTQDLGLRNRASQGVLYTTKKQNLGGSTIEVSGGGIRTERYMNDEEIEQERFRV